MGLAAFCGVMSAVSVENAVSRKAGCTLAGRNAEEAIFSGPHLQLLARRHVFFRVLFCSYAKRKPNDLQGAFTQRSVSLYQTAVTILQVSAPIKPVNLFVPSSSA